MELVALTIIVAAFLLREHLALTERREWAKERSLLLTRIQAPAQALTITELPADDDDRKLYMTEADEEREWTEANK